jgi:serine/threonine protein kinase
MSLAAEVVDRVRSRVGTVLCEKWRLERMLGIGGMAAVYAAVHRNQNRVAIKMLHAEHSIDANVRGRFLREGYVANTVDHPGTVRVFDDDITSDGAAFLVMELLHGETLEERADRKGGKLPTGEALVLIDQLLDVLVAAHDKSILHRDVKPDNLFLTTEGRLKVLDFGIARLRELSGIDDGSTGIGTFMGTPAFMAPEQARGRWDEVDARSDIWSAGATLYSLLSGRNVHEADTVTDQLVLAVTQPAPSLASVEPHLPRPVIDLVDKALSFRKDDRWQDARSMQDALRQALSTVERPGLLSVPSTSYTTIEVDRSADTIALPPELVSEITGPSPGTLTSAVTTTGVVRTRSRARKLGLLLGVGVLSASAIVALIAALRSSPSAETEASTADRAVAAEPAPAAGMGPAAGPEIATLNAGESDKQAAEVASAVRVAPAPRDASAAMRSRTGLAGRSFRVPRPMASAAAKPAASEKSAAPPPVTDNPFDRRY